MSENQSPRFMLMFTIGPVQSFIEAARKTEDLWMGSYILSYLIATAMEKVKGNGVEIIYPAVGTESPFKFWRKNFATPSFPNLFLAIGSGIPQDDLVTHAKKAEKKVKSEFESMAENVLNETFKASTPWRGTYVEDIFNRQIPNFFDIYWVITEKETEEEYGKWYARTAGSLAAIKNCRTFKQTSEFGRKCSLDGTREILHLEEGESVDQAMKWWKDFAKATPRHCRQKEALSAVSLTKRRGRHFLENYSKFNNEFTDNGPSFPSTSEVATASFKKRMVCKPDALEVYTKFCNAVKELRQSDDEEATIPTIKPLPKIKCPLPNNVDGEWLYEETYNDSYLERYYNIDVSNGKGQIERCRELRNQLVQSLGGEPGKYYAAIALDGDDMGEKIREAKSQKQHAKRSKRLINYSKKVRRIVEEEHLGKLTYAGGDDLLALANLEDLLSILKKLREKFPRFTGASAGVCIAHNKMPLGDVLQHARRMEKEAKKEGGKDALGIALFKRSGNISEMVTKWTYSDLNVLDVSEELIELLRDGEVSKRFLYSFREIFVKLIEDEKDFIALGRPLIQTEFRRIMEGAHSTKGTQSKINQEIIDSLVQLIRYIRPFRNFLGYLEIANFVARGKK